MVGTAVPLAAAPLTTATFAQFGTQHLVILGIWLAGCVFLAVLGRRMRGRAGDPVIRYVLAVALLGFAALTQLGRTDQGGGPWQAALPLQLCDLAWMAAVWTLFRGGWRSRSLLYFWGLTLTTQAVLTPSLNDLWPDPSFIGWWGTHLLTPWAAAYLCLGLGRGPGWRGYRWALLCTYVWGVLMMGFNALVGTNFGFLNSKPPSASLLDLLGPWPVYVLAVGAILAMFWALMTWPWVVAGRRQSGRRDADTPRVAEPRAADWEGG